MTLEDIFPPPADLLELEPEDIAPLLLRYIAQGEGRNINRYNMTLQTTELGKYASGRYDEVARAVTEAWMVLEKDGLIAPEPGQSSSDWVFVTRRGMSLKDHTDYEAYQKGRFLPRGNLDPTLETKARPLFLRGDYDTAVFRAYKEVEVRVRTAAGLPRESLGVDLMRKAFHPQTGKLSDSQRSVGERQAMSDLFAGAVGLFKNPSSHRHVTYAAEEAAALIRFATYLIEVVEWHSSGGPEENLGTQGAEHETARSNEG